MKCDERGNVWVTGPGGVWVYAPSGELIGKLHVPEVVANLAWGGTELRTLFATATHSVYRLTTKVGPRIEPYMRVHAAAMSASAHAVAPGLDLDPQRAVLIIQDMQNDAVRAGHLPRPARRATRKRRAWSKTFAAWPRRLGLVAFPSFMSGSLSSPERLA